MVLETTKVGAAASNIGFGVSANATGRHPTVFITSSLSTLIAHPDSNDMSTTVSENAIRLDGLTQVYYVIGDPIAQVKSPAAVTKYLQAAGRNGVVVPAHVRPTDLAAFLTGIEPVENVAGVIATVPHKFAVVPFCASLGENAQAVGTVNILRRRSDGKWHGDMYDGIGMVQALANAGCRPVEQRALMIGAGGAGTAIAHALLNAGVRSISISDFDLSRSELLVNALNSRRPGSATLRGSNEAASKFDIVVNASSSGLRESDPSPVDLTGAASSLFVADVVTGRETALIRQARSLGCKTVTGDQMFDEVCECMVDFLIQG